MTTEEICTLVKGARPGCVICAHEAEIPAEANEDAREGFAAGKDPRLTRREWIQKLLCTSGAELSRAVAAGVIHDEPRGYGRRHAERVIDPSEVTRYLQQRALLVACPDDMHPHAWAELFAAHGSPSIPIPQRVALDPKAAAKVIKAAAPGDRIRVMAEMAKARISAK